MQRKLQRNEDIDGLNSIQYGPGDFDDELRRGENQDLDLHRSTEDMGQHVQKTTDMFDS